MTSAVQGTGTSSALARPNSSSLADVIDSILDKGLVIDAFVRVSLVGIELITIDARVVVASVDTYLRFAEAVNRLDLGTAEGSGVPELIDDVQSGGAKSKTMGALEGVGETLKGMVGLNEADDKETARKATKK